MFSSIILTLLSIGCEYDSIPPHVCSDMDSIIVSLSSCNNSLTCISPIFTSIINSIEPFQDVNTHKAELSYVKVNISEVVVSGLDGVNVVLEDEEGDVRGVVTAPSIVARGIYQVEGYVFNFIPIYGNGPFTIELEEVSVRLKASTSSLDQSVNLTKIDLNAENVTVFLENLLDNNYPRLANLINSQLSSYFLSYSPIIETWIINYLNNFSQSNSSSNSTSNSYESSTLNSTSVDFLEKDQLSRPETMPIGKVTSFGENVRKQHDDSTEINQVLDNQGNDEDDELLAA